jgi:flagellar basal-body rod protein FlgC
MSFLDSLNVSASGLSAQRLRMNLISTNLANVNTTRTLEGGPFQRKDAVFAAVPQEGQDRFSSILANSMGDRLQEVRVIEIRNDSRPPLLKYDPEHPDADADGYVAQPNINVMEEMVNMLTATRSYEANVTAVKATKDMAVEALDIGR